MVRDRSALRRAFHVREDEAEYLQDARGREEEINLWDYSPELTRPFRALKVWMSLQVFGAEAFAAAIERTMRLAEFAEAQLREDPLWEVTSRAQMAVVTFRCAPESWPAERVDALNRTIAARMQEVGFALVLRGQTVLRLCTINPRTSEEDIAKTAAALGQSARKAMRDLDKLSG